MMKEGEQTAMIRDFTQKKKEELYQALEAIDNKDWMSFMMWCGARAADFGEWPGRLGIAFYTEQIDRYQKEVLHTNYITRIQIDAVFEDVSEIDQGYAKIFQEHAEEVKEQIKRVQRMIQAMQSAGRTVSDIGRSLNGMNPQAEISYKEQIENGRQMLENHLKMSGTTEPEEQQKICDWIMKNRPDMLAGLYRAAQYGGMDEVKVYHSMIDYYKTNRYRDIDYIIEQISEEDVTTKEEMFSLETYDLLARMIYQEMHNPANGGQDKVLWITVNRYFSEKDFTGTKEKNLRIVLEKGGFASINKNDGNTFNAYHPDYESEGWKNAKRLAAILYSQIGEAYSKDVDEEKVREAICASQDIYGNNIENTIGNCDSFWGDGSENHFYEY